VSEIDPKLSRLYREASSESPPKALDAAILAAARRQLGQSRRPARSSWVRWMAPASALATLVVAVSLAFLVEREQPETMDKAVTSGIPPRPRSPVPAQATESGKAMAVDSAAPATEKQEAAAAPVMVPAASLPVPASAARAPQQSPVLAAPAAAPVSRRAESSLRSVEPAPPAAQAFPAESRAKAGESKMNSPKAATEANFARDSAPGAAGAAAPAAAGRLAPLRQPAMQRSPESWLEEIGRLKREGRDKEAAEQLAEFRKAYPAHAVPESLLQ
jgi:hypothetical protein